MTQMRQATPESIAQAAALLRAGEVVAFPTETVYGLGADALQPDAVSKIFAAKGRPGDNPLIVHVAAVESVEPLVRCCDARARALMARFWPGPLTLVLPKAARVPREVTAGLDSVGIRLPAHPVARALIAAAGTPVAAPSANRSGKPSPTLAQHVLDDLQGCIPLILDGGPCEVGLESTVLDLTADVPIVLRPGGITPDMLRTVVGEVMVDRSALSPLLVGEVPRSPGMKYTHYAPNAAVTIIAGGQAARFSRVCALYDQVETQGHRAAILTPWERCADYAPRFCQPWGALQNPNLAASELFGALRAVDAAGFSHVFAEAVEADGVGLAVMNRLCRAAGFHIVQAE